MEQPIPPIDDEASEEEVTVVNTVELHYTYAGETPDENSQVADVPSLHLTVTDSDVEHWLFNGENLDALYHFNQEDSPYSLLGQVDVCYIDPPYNTGNGTDQGFVYNDNFRTKGDKHSQWLSFMKDRLEPLPSLLADTGVVIVSIDDSEVHRLRMLMDEMFGERNFIAQLIVDGGNPKNNARFFSVTHEYMLVYAKNLSALQRSGRKFRKERDGIDILLREYEKQKRTLEDDYTAITEHLKNWVKTQPLSKRLKVFYNADSRGLYTYADLSTPGKNGARYEILHPVTGKPCQVPSRGWGMSKAKMDALIADDMVIFGQDETQQPLKKLYLRNRKDQVQKSILEYPSRSSTHLLERILGRRSSFNNPKNLDMIQDLITLVCPDDGVVLDYFAGSGTTGHATVSANLKEGSSRKFVLVTNNENGIFDDVTYPRLQQVFEQANKKSKPVAQELKVFSIGQAKNVERFVES